MEMSVSKEEIDQLGKIMNSYVVNPTEENLRRIHANLKKIGDTIDWAKFYLNTNEENGLKPYAQKFLNSAKILSRYMALEKQMRVLQRTDPCQSPYPVNEQLERKS